MDPQADPKERPAFLTPPPDEPFWRTSEGKKILAFAALFFLALAMGVGAYLRARAHESETSAFAKPAGAPSQPTAQAEPAAGGDAVAAGDASATPSAGAAGEEGPAAPAPGSTTPAAPTKPQRVEFEGALLDSANGTDFAETTGYRKLVDIVASFKPAEFERRVSGLLDYESVMKDPEAWRGQYVRVRGVIGGIIAQRLERPIFALTDVWRGTISQPDASDAVVFDLVEEPPKIDVQREVLDLEGIFYRTVRFESRTGQMRVAPYVIARVLKPLPPELQRKKSFLAAQSPYLLVAVAALIVLSGWLLIRFLDRRQRRPTSPRSPQPSIGELLDRKLREERAAAARAPRDRA